MFGTIDASDSSLLFKNTHEQEAGCVCVRARMYKWPDRWRRAAELSNCQSKEKVFARQRVQQQQSVQGRSGE